LNKLNRWLPGLLAALLLNALAAPLAAQAPVDPDAHLKAGLELAAAGKLLEAEQQVREALKLSPAHTAALTALGQILTRNGRTAEARATFEKVVELQPNSPGAHINLGILLADTGQTAEALAAFGKAVELAPDSPLAHHNLGRSLLDTGRIDEARTHLEKAIELDPSLAIALRSLALLEQGRQNLERSSELLRREIQAAPSAEAHYLLGLNLSRLSETEAAIEQWELALASGSNHREALFRLSQSLRRTDPEKAREYNRRFLALRKAQSVSDRAGTLGDTALVLSKAGNYPEAIAKLIEAITLCGNCSAEGLLRKNLGIIYARAGDYENSARQLQAAAKLRPNDSEIQSVLDQFEEAGIGALQKP